MAEKSCTHCNIIKEEFNFSKKGIKTCARCKDCDKVYYQNNKLLILEKRKNYRIDNKEKLNARTKNWKLNNKEKDSCRKKEYYEANKNAIRKNYKEYYQKNKTTICKEKVKYITLKLKEDSLYKFKHSTRNLIRGSFKRGKNNLNKEYKTENILGCTIKDFRIYIESRFKDNMSFDNHGQWHLDHIIPLSIAETEEEVIKLNHYTNFQPLWAEENLKKSNTYEKFIVE
jgi:hypothetical protein